MEKRYGIKIVGTAKENNTNFKGEVYVCVMGKRDSVLEAHGAMWKGFEVKPNGNSILENGYRGVMGAAQSLKKWMKYQEEFWDNDVSIIEYYV